MKFTVAKNDLKLAERIKIKRLGKVTVRTARDHLSGGTLVILAQSPCRPC